MLAKDRIRDAAVRRDTADLASAPGAAGRGHVAVFRTSRVRLFAVPVAVATLLSIHAGLLAYAATRHSPTLNEPGHLVAGLSYWEFRRFEVYRVNPPLTHLIAALPVLAAGYEADWDRFSDRPGARPEFAMGSDFIKANGERSIWLFTIARWACIPISLIGGIFCFVWARELYGTLAGLAALALWCFSPNILAHAELITPDAAATAFGMGAGYMFWRWLKVPTWERTGCAALLLGLAELSKMSWLFLFGLWPLLWVFWRLTRHKDRWFWSAWRKQGLQMGVILVGGLYLLNLGYLFDGSFTQLKEFTFVSETLAGQEEAGNRFAGTWLGSLPVPLPEQYVLGLDTQKRDFEDYRQPSYLRGEWKDGGWWYYYLYGCLVKVPHGTQLLVLMALLFSNHMLAATNRSSLDLVVLLLPAATLFVLASSQCEFSHHFRYVLPGFGFLTVLMGGLATVERPSLRAASMICVVATALSMLLNYPHQLAYFNEGSGGSRRGSEHLLGSNYDWGQDIPLEWNVFRRALDESSPGRAVLVTEHQSDIAALFPDDVELLNSAVRLGNYDAQILVISLSALKCEAPERRRRYVDFVSTWLARQNGHAVASYPSPTILQLRATKAPMLDLP
ncbi:MAG: glycosyltransferase family 39 protein [Planctomycetaceae bacterium]|nr:glycosyltransferase family 39 protein [Planctomycetaceae bacterium]